MHNAHAALTTASLPTHEQEFVLDKYGNKMYVARFFKDMNAFPHTDIPSEQQAIIDFMERANRERFRFLAAEGKRYENDE